MKEAQNEFFKYTENYKKYGPKIELKISHTVRVEKLCVDIAESLNLSDEDVELADMCGLLHDIARFEQWKRYQTYSDLASLDHGDLGVEILKKNNFINKFTKKNHETIFRAVKYHNKYRVPNTISNRNKMFVNITRDADKIDILQLFVNGGLVNHTEDAIISDKVYKAILDKKEIKRTDVKTKADDIAVRLGFVFDLNFKRSYEILKETDYINKMIDVQIKDTKNETLVKQLNELREFVNKYIGEMIKC